MGFRARLIHRPLGGRRCIHPSRIRLRGLVEERTRREGLREIRDIAILFEQHRLRAV